MVLMLKHGLRVCVCFRTRAPAWNLSSTLMHLTWAPQALTPVTHHRPPHEVPTNPRAQPCQSPPVSETLQRAGRLGVCTESQRDPTFKEKQGSPWHEAEVASWSPLLALFPSSFLPPPHPSLLHALVPLRPHEADIQQVSCRPGEPCDQAGG